MMLLKHEETLRNLFAVYAKANIDPGSKYQSSQSMSLGEWVTFINHIGLIATGQVRCWQLHSQTSAEACLRCIPIDS